VNMKIRERQGTRLTSATRGADGRRQSRRPRRCPAAPSALPR
jgi:hypothetical protein